METCILFYIDTMSRNESHQNMFLWLFHNVGAIVCDYFHGYIKCPPRLLRHMELERHSSHFDIKKKRYSFYTIYNFLHLVEPVHDPQS